MQIYLRPSCCAASVAVPRPQPQAQIQHDIAGATARLDDPFQRF